MPDYCYEAKQAGLVAGIDEAGRGPLAGPVVAAAVILNPSKLPPHILAAIDDSKALPQAKREAIAIELVRFNGEGVIFAIAAASTREIERINILQASFLAMRRAVQKLHIKPDYVLVDGHLMPSDMGCAGEAIIGGDALCLSIAAASILAKVTRDRAMRRLALIYPNYAWHTNVGYATAEHRAALAIHGPCRHHRRTFAPIDDLFSERPSKTVCDP